MKKSELRKIIKEEIQNMKLNESYLNTFLEPKLLKQIDSKVANELGGLFKKGDVIMDTDESVDFEEFMEAGDSYFPINDLKTLKQYIATYCKYLKQSSKGKPLCAKIIKLSKEI